MPRGKKQSSEEDDSPPPSESESSDMSSEVSDDSGSESEEAPKKRAPPKKKAPAKKAAPARRAPKRKRKDPNAPKKKQSAYMFFLADNRERIKTENPGITFGEIGRKAGQMWNALTESEKEPYNKKSEKDKARYEKEMENYSPPSEDSSEDEPPRKRVRGGKGPAKKKKDPNAPKNPMNAYFFYVKENRESYKAKHSDLKMTEITKALGAQWKEMNEKEREPYQKLADGDKERYKKEMEEFNNQ